MLRRLGSAYATRVRQNWPNGIAILVFFIASEFLDDENGDKSASAWIVSGVVGLVVLLVLRWVRNDPGIERDDGALPDR